MTEIKKSRFNCCNQEQEFRQWISTSERLPDSAADFLVYTEDGYMDLAFFNMTGGEFWKKVIYWMPLPLPPKEANMENASIIIR